MSASIALVAVALDYWLGEPHRAHPLVGFGRLADRLESGLRRGKRQRLSGLLAWCIAVLPLVWIAHGLSEMDSWGRFAEILLLFLCLGGSSLTEHATRVRQALWDGKLGEAREAVGAMVSRETSELDESAVAAATVESVLENGSDAIFGTLFWFAVAGAPGAVLYRLANTLDAMWGYRNERYRYFGWAAARLDDLLNLIPARLTATTYALLGDRRRAWASWRRQAGRWDSPNAGPVMAAGAGSLGIRLGGPARYHGEWRKRPILGTGRAAVPADITRALALVNRSLLLWLAVLVSVDVLT